MSDPRELRRRWTARLVTAAVLWVILVGGGNVLGNHPRPLLLALGVAAFATVLWLYLDTSAVHEPPDWDRAVDDPVRPPGEDPRLALLTRVVAQHLTAREVGPTLQVHLRDLADHRLVARHGVAWRTDPDRAAPLLGPELTSLAQQRPPYPRMSIEQIDLLLTRIEAL